MNTDFDPQIYERDIYEESIYSSWLKYTNERDLLEKILRERMREWVTKDHISIIDIGCSVGSAAERLFKVLGDNKITYDYTGIDPYGDQLKKFRERHPEESIKLIQKSLEDIGTGIKYDLAYVIHSLYYVDDIKSALEKIIKISSKAIIVHHGERGINTIHQQFSKYVKPGPNIISTHKLITSSLDEIGKEYTFENYETTVDVTPCHDPKNKDGVNMIKFFLEQSELPQNIIEEVSAFIREEIGDTMIHDMGLIITK